MRRTLLNLIIEFTKGRTLLIKNFFFLIIKNACFFSYYENILT
jgi:hypothetical protein